MWRISASFSLAIAWFFAFFGPQSGKSKREKGFMRTALNNI